VFANPDGGPAPFGLLTYAAARQRAAQIAAVTRSRYMPPWKATPESGEFVGQQPLTDAQIDLIGRWADAGAPEGNPRDLPRPPRRSEGWQLGTPDLTVTLPEAYTLRADGTTKALIDIADWDFRWQHIYRLVTPLALPRGTTLAMRYTYDSSDANARNPQRPPARARWGQPSRNEMGDLWIQMLTRSAADLDTLNAEARRKMAAEDAVGYEVLLGESPGDVALHDDAAVLYMQLGRHDEAVRHFEASAALDPGNAAPHFNLGTALTLAGRLEPAIVAYRRALQIDPKYSSAHNNLGNVLAALGRLDEALGHLEQAVRPRPGQRGGAHQPRTGEEGSRLLKSNLQLPRNAAKRNGVL
jgi:tetratricopeptide (TPR) repeat protein